MFLGITGEIEAFDDNDPQCDGFICECAEIFLDEVIKGPFPIRKPSNPKAKKIAAMDFALDSQDDLLSHRLQMIKTKVKPRPPFGKCWITQIYAGQMGLTILAVLYGMLFGIPCDIALDGWDAATPAGCRQLHLDFQSEDPYCTVITQPCGPWGNWSRFNIAKGSSAGATVLQLRADGRPNLKSVNKTIKDRVRANRHIFMEQPLGSQVLDEPEMADVRKMVEDGTLLFLVVDGCMVGYRDKVSGLPHRKPSFYITSMVAAESVFGHCKCDGSEGPCSDFYRRQSQHRQTGNRTYNWYGPARVIGVELRNPRRTEDGDPGTAGSAPSSYWLRYGPSVVLASGEQLRFASEDELLAAHCVPHFSVERGSERGARNYVDVRNQLLPASQLLGGENINTPDYGLTDFWQTHADGRVVRVHNVA